MKTIIVRSNGEDIEFSTNADSVGSLKMERNFRERFGFPDAAEITINGAPASNNVKITEGDVVSYTIRAADKGNEEGVQPEPEAEPAQDTDENKNVEDAGECCTDTCTAD